MSEPEIPEPVDLHEPVMEICRRLGLDPRTVRAIELNAAPARARATVTTYRLDDDGEKLLEEDPPRLVLELAEYRIDL